VCPWTATGVGPHPVNSGFPVAIGDQRINSKLAHFSDLLTLAAWNLGFKDEAIEQCKIALNFEPNNQRFKDNLAIMERLYHHL